MSKLRILSGKEVCSILEKQGFAKVDNSTVTVPVPNHSEIKIGTLMSIIRQSRLPKELFEA